MNASASEESIVFQQGDQSGMGGPRQCLIPAAQSRRNCFTRELQRIFLKRSHLILLPAAPQKPHMNMQIPLGDAAEIQELQN